MRTACEIVDLAQGPAHGTQITVRKGLMEVIWDGSRYRRAVRGGSMHYLGEVQTVKEELVVSDSVNHA